MLSQITISFLARRSFKLKKKTFKSYINFWVPLKSLKGRLYQQYISEPQFPSSIRAYAIVFSRDKLKNVQIV